MANALENSRELGIDPHEILEKTKVRVRERFEQNLDRHCTCGCPECRELASEHADELMKILDEENVIWGYRDCEIVIRVSDDFGDDEVRFKEGLLETMSTKRIAEVISHLWLDAEI